MTFIINGEEQEVAAATLTDLLTALDYDGDWLAGVISGQGRAGWGNSSNTSAYRDRWPPECRVHENLMGYFAENRLGSAIYKNHHTSQGPRH